MEVREGRRSTRSPRPSGDLVAFVLSPSVPADRSKHEPDKCVSVHRRMQPVLLIIFNRNLYLFCPGTLGYDGIVTLVLPVVSDPSRSRPWTPCPCRSGIGEVGVSMCARACVGCPRVSFPA